MPICIEDLFLPIFDNQRNQKNFTTFQKRAPQPDRESFSLSLKNFKNLSEVKDLVIFFFFLGKKQRVQRSGKREPFLLSSCLKNQECLYSYPLNAQHLRFRKHLRV